MSAQTRQALATAATSVSGVTVRPYYRQTTKALDGWVRFDRVARDDSGFGWLTTWQVAVILPQEQRGAELAVEKLLEPLLDALDAEGVVTSAQPVQLALETGTVPALIVTVVA